MNAKLSRQPLLAVLVLITLAGFLGCGKTGDDECDASTFGVQCADNNTAFLRCGHTSCEDSYGLPCDEYTKIEKLNCPAARPTCKKRLNVAGNDIVCVGENVGTCDQLGFVRCDDSGIVVYCIVDENGQLFLSRGSCGQTQKCYAPFKFHAGGCTDLTPP